MRWYAVVILNTRASIPAGERWLILPADKTAAASLRESKFIKDSELKRQLIPLWHN
jgi:hypothetical protein